MAGCPVDGQCLLAVAGRAGQVPVGERGGRGGGQGPSLEQPERSGPRDRQRLLQARGRGAILAGRVVHQHPAQQRLGHQPGVAHPAGERQRLPAVPVGRPRVRPLLVDLGQHQQCLGLLDVMPDVPGQLERGPGQLQCGRRLAGVTVDFGQAAQSDRLPARVADLPVPGQRSAGPAQRRTELAQQPVDNPEDGQAVSAVALLAGVGDGGHEPPDLGGGLPQPAQVHKGQPEVDGDARRLRAAALPPVERPRVGVATQRLAGLAEVQVDSSQVAQHRTLALGNLHRPERAYLKLHRAPSAGRAPRRAHHPAGRADPQQP
jgi:hypothetical protein